VPPEWPQLVERLRRGAWAALAGLVLQLTGIGWDTLQHHNDPGLAVRESVLSLTNPSHLLMAVGMSVVVVAVGYCLFCLGSARTGPRPSTAAAIGVVVLATVWLAVASVSLRTGGISGRHDHGTTNDHGHNGTAERELTPR